MSFAVTAIFAACIPFALTGMIALKRFVSAQKPETSQS